MDLQQFLTWWSHNNVFLIQLLIMVLLGGAVFLLYRSVFVNESSGGDSNLSEIEKTLRKVLDNAAVNPSAEVERASAAIQDSDDLPPPPPPASPAVTEAQKKEMEALKLEIQSREATMKELQKSLEDAKLAVEAAKNSAPTAPVVDTKELEAKLKELQAKLTEYEIIEDDIANLSTYKNENSKLKTELENLKGKFGNQIAETGTNSDNVKQFAALMGTAAPPTVPNRPSPSTPPQSTVAPVAEAAPAAAIPAAPPNSAPPPAIEAAAPSAPAPNVEVAVAPATSAPIGDVVVDEGAAADNVLGNLDTDKLLAETKDLTPSEVKPAEEGDQGQKLINEFENFMKGG